MKLPDSNKSHNLNDNKVSQIIQQAKNELEHMIDMTPQIMLLTNRDAKILRANKALLEFLHIINFNDILGQHLNNIFSCKDENFFNDLIHCKSCYESVNIDVELKEQGLRTLSFTIIGSADETNPVVLIVHDITGENEQAVYLEKKYKKQAIQALMGGLMHNINQPLTVLTLKTQLMYMAIEKGVSNPDEFKQGLQDIMNLTLQISNMLKQAEEPKDYVTQHYINNVNILDIERSAGNNEPAYPINTTLLNMLIEILNTHAPGEASHAERVSKYAVLLARQLGLKESEIHSIKNCAFFHDIGKIGVPGNIQKKQESLTGAERKQMKKHVEIGYNILKEFPFLSKEADTARFHHEWFDGNGYSEGLRGNSIPLSIRIISIVDVFDALCSDRPYSVAIPPEHAAKKIIKGSGKQFDPDVVNAFKKNYNNWNIVNSKASN